jgi:hypothetical protein
MDFVNLIVMRSAIPGTVTMPRRAARVAPATSPVHRGSLAWSPPRLLALATRYGLQVRPWAQFSALPPGERRYERLERTVDYEVWVIHWSTDGGLVLHDHGGSSGAFHVVCGALDETSTTRLGRHLHRRRLVRSEGKSFGPDYVYSVVNLGEKVATSVHAYAPPLTSMNFYSTSGTGLVPSHVETHWAGAP